MVKIPRRHYLKAMRERAAQDPVAESPSKAGKASASVKPSKAK